MTEKEIARFVFTKRAEKGISLRNLALHSGVPDSTISRFERGIQSIQLRNFIDLLDALGYKLEITEKVRRKKNETAKK